MNHSKSIPKTALLLCCFMLLLTARHAHAQLNGGVTPMVAQPNGPPAKPTVTGPASVTQPAGTSTYTASTSPTSGTSYSWSLSTSAAGTISGTTTSGSLHWNSTFSGSVSVFCTASNTYGSATSNAYVVTATIPATPLVAGTISAAATNINSGTAAILTGSPATGGNGTYSYQWQSSATSNGTFTNITGAALVNYTNPGLTVTTYYRRMDASNGSANTNVVGITVSPALVAGAVTPASQGALSGAPLTNITSAAPTGGNGNYTYQWQSAPDNATWTNIISNANGLTYVPGNATATVYYRLAVTSNGQTLYSGSSAVLVSACNALGTVPTASQNYIMTTTFRQAGVVSGITNAQIAAMGVCQANQTIQYLDGLGRPIQRVQVKASAAGYDMIQPEAYDIYGREATKYLPYTLGSASTGNGSYQSTAINDQATFYNPSGSTGTQQGNGIVRTDAPFAVTGFEASPLNRVIEQGTPGDAWQLSTSGVSGSGNTAKIAYSTNAASEVTLWSVNSTANGATGNSSYLPGTLYKTTTTDENGNNSIEYKNLEGLVVCKMVQNGTAYLATYYVYDDINNLTYVIPPIPSALNSQVTAYPTSFLETDPVFLNYMYGYHYDYRNRIVQKKIPGKGWEFMVYNTLDQLTFSQDGNQRNQTPQVYTYFKYDALGRQVIIGLWSSTGAPGYQGDANISSPSLTLFQWLTTWQASQTSFWVTRDNTTSTGYSTSNPPGPSLTINYYDDYTFTGQPSAFTAPTGAITAAKGLPTATKTMVLNTINNTTPDMLWKVNYYDGLGRTIQTYAQHYLGGVLSVYNYDVITNTYNFANQVIGTTRQQYIKNSGNTAAVPAVTIANTYLYDQVGRKKQTFEQISGGTNILLSDYEYNEVGQLMTKNLHSTNSGSSYLQSIGYTYNERGWTVTMNSGLLGQSLLYTNPQVGSPQYNGNIAEYIYTKTGTGIQTVLYSYDNLNRLTYSGSSDALGETVIYDVLGNITSLTRLGTLAATLAYSYPNGNLLGSVTNNGAASRSYSYDNNGNAGSDGTNKLIQYNMLNLPQMVTQNGTTLATYTYDADGNKLRNSGSDGYWDYDDGIVYNGTTASNGTIQFVQTEVGRAVPQGGSWDYTYNLTDHLGNVRISFDADPSTGAARRIQEDEYYAFGLRSQVYNYSNNNRYLYNGKEIQTDLSSQYDYGARFYDPVIARWTTPDPLADKAYSMTPFRYAFNNPVRIMDPDGAYEVDGHFWTVYLMLTMMGNRNAYNISAWTEWPDLLMYPSGDAAGANNSWIQPFSQQRIHALTGGSSAVERAASYASVIGAENSSDLGIALHRLGDSYAHSRVGNESQMYGASFWSFGHAWDSEFGTDPDAISNRPELYRKYTSQLAGALSERFGFKGKLDMFTFDYVAGSGGNTLQNSAVFETEISIRQGLGSFSVEGNQVDAIGNYVKSSNNHFGRSVKAKSVYTDVDVYNKDADGNWVKTKSEKRTFVTLK